MSMIDDRDAGYSEKPEDTTYIRLHRNETETPVWETAWQCKL